MQYRLSSNARIEELDGDVVVLDLVGAYAHRLTGDAAEVALLVSSGVRSDAVAEHLRSALDDLVERGVVVSSGWSRRKFLMATGAATAGATIISVGLPSAAAASSLCPGRTPHDELPKTYTADGTFRPGPSVTSVSYVIGGGGGGGGGSAMTGGGGGGSGGTLSGSITVVPCQEYTVVVGGGGAAGLAGSGNASGGPGGAGGTSSFNGASATGGAGGGGGTNSTAVGAGGAGGSPAGTAGTAGTGGMSGMGGAGGTGTGGAGSGGAGADPNNNPGASGAGGSVTIS